MIVLLAKIGPAPSRALKTCHHPIRAPSSGKPSSIGSDNLASRSMGWLRKHWSSFPNNSMLGFVCPAGSLRRLAAPVIAS